MAPILAGKTQFSRCLSVVSTSGSALSGNRRRPKLSDQPQNFPEQATRHRDLGHLERDVAAVANNPAHRRIASQAIGVVHVLLATEAAED